MRRKEALENNGTYHIFTRSIADFVIFNDDYEFSRIIQLMKYYQIKNELRFSKFITLRKVQKGAFNNLLKVISSDKGKMVQIIAYCLMPTHIHFILKQLRDKGISKYIGNILNGFTKFFNTKHKRKGPLWESKFKNVSILKDEQLIHLTRYIHLNPVTAGLVKKPEMWEYSSYKEYLSGDNNSSTICEYDDILDIKPKSYQKFVNDQISYQKELAKIKKIIID